MSDVDKSFKSYFFSDSDVNSILQDNEQKILIMFDDKKNAERYSAFREDFVLYLSKLPNSIMKQQVQNLYNRNLIFLGISKIKSDNVFVRLLLMTDEKLAGVVLDTQQLNIDPESGKSETIDECVYASYFGLIRAAVLLNKESVQRDKDLHKLMTTYLYLLVVKAIGAGKIYSEKHRNFIHILVIYIYYKNYLKQKHSSIISTIEREYEKVVGGKEILDEFLPSLENLEGYSTIKDLPKILIDTKIYGDPPNNLIVALIKILKPIGFYALLGSLDYFIGLVVISKYPVDFFSRESCISQKVQDGIEEIMDGYMNKVKYSQTNLLKKPT